MPDSIFLFDDTKRIDVNFIINSSHMLDRDKCVYEFNKILHDIDLSVGLENGIFEAMLLYITLNELGNHYISSIYYDKYNEILININDDPQIKNRTLKSTLLDKKIDPRYIAFMSPSQYHPQKWEEITKKNTIREQKENNISTSDIYKCSKCGKSKCIIRQEQTRSADEPSTIYVHCLNCGKTFKQ